MTKKEEFELLIAIVFLLIGFAFGLLSGPMTKQHQLQKIKQDKALEILWDKYEWKTKRLRVYTDIIYKND